MLVPAFVTTYSMICFDLLKTGNKGLLISNLLVCSTAITNITLWDFYFFFMGCQN